MGENSSISSESSLLRREAELRNAHKKLAEEQAHLEKAARSLKRRRRKADKNQHVAKIPKRPSAAPAEPPSSSEEAIALPAAAAAAALPPRPGTSETPDPPALPPRPGLKEAQTGSSYKPVEADDHADEAQDRSARPGHVAPAPPPRPTAPLAEVPAPAASAAPRPKESASPAEAESPADEPSESFLSICKSWFSEAGGAYLASMLFHAALLMALFLFLGVRYIHQKLNEGTKFEAVEVVENVNENLEAIKLDQLNDGQPSDLDLKALNVGDENSKSQDGEAIDAPSKYFDDSPTFEDAGGGLKSDVAADAPQLGGASFDFATLRDGPTMKGPGGLGAGGEGITAGLGGIGSGPLGGRGMGARKVRAGQKGGSRYSEAAVEAALKWIAAHQNPDGSWNYDHQPAGHCKCGNPGNSTGSFGSTALGLLPFLSAGYTHREGKYKKTVEGGLNYLVTKMVVDPAKGTGTMIGGNEHMYAHGLATIALTEAYGMTKDSKLRMPAQSALNWIIASQSADRNFWGYNGGGGDTSVSGWQIMALKSGKSAYLKVPPETWPVRVSKGLDGVQSEYGAYYGYGGPGKTPAMTAVGLLSRMYLGANQKNPTLAQGMTYLVQTGPDLNDMYYTYYANQAMFQYTNGEGPQWQKWNTVLRDGLIKTQGTQGHEAGSWKHCKFIAQGGRLYSTSLCCMCLQVYYRYMSVYQREGQGGRQPRADVEKAEK